MVFFNSRGELIKITYFGAQRKMARLALACGNKAKAMIHFRLIRQGKQR